MRRYKIQRLQNKALVKRYIRKGDFRFVSLNHPWLRSSNIIPERAIIAPFPVTDRPFSMRSTSRTFHLFPLLPTELKIQIFTYHAHTSISSNGSFKSYLLHNNHNCRLLSLHCAPGALYLAFDSKFTCQSWNCKELHLPPALKICHLSRQVMLDLLWELFGKGRADLGRTGMSYWWDDARYKDVKLRDFRTQEVAEVVKPQIECRTW